MKRARQMEARVANLKWRIATVNHLIAECDRTAADLDREIRIEEDRTKIHNPAYTAYSTYAKATASRRDNLRRSADEFRAQLAKDENLLRELDETSFRLTHFKTETLFLGDHEVVSQ